MKFTKALLARIPALMSADSNYLGIASQDFHSFRAIISNFTESPGLLFSDLVFADGEIIFQPPNNENGSWANRKDPRTGDAVLSIVIASEPFRLYSGGVVFPITVYGFALVNTDTSVLLAVEKFAEPVVFTEAAQSFDILPPNLRFPSSMAK